VIAAAVRGRVELAFARRGARTILARSRVDSPMATVRPFQLPDGGLVAQLITLGPGLCAGDSVHIDIEAGEGARVIVTTTAATRVMSMEADGRAEQRVRLRAARHATLEYYPCVTIPFPGSVFQQTIHVAADADARVAVVEAWALGRTARDEYLRFARISSRTTLDVDNVTIYADVTDLDPSSHCELAGAGVLDKRRYVASGFWYGVTLDGAPEAAGCDGAVSVAFGQSRPRLAYLRALADNAPAMDEVLRRSGERVATAWRVPAVRLDRFRC